MRNTWIYFIQNFNPQAALNIMCKSLISISWDGLMYDCDFNQMLDITVNDKKEKYFSDQ